MKVTLYLRLKSNQREIIKRRLNLIKNRDSVLVEILFDGTVEILEVKPHTNETYMELREEEFMSLPMCAGSEFIGVLFDGTDELDSKVVL